MNKQLYANIRSSVTSYVRGVATGLCAIPTFIRMYTEDSPDKTQQRGYVAMGVGAACGVSLNAVVLPTWVTDLQMNGVDSPLGLILGITQIASNATSSLYELYRFHKRKLKSEDLETKV